MAGIPIEPAGPPGVEVFEQRAAELIPEDASSEVHAGIAQVAVFAQRRAERQWQKQQPEAGVAALDWFGKNPGASVLAMPPEIRDWLAPDQWRSLEALAIEGRLRTDDDLFERLDRQMVYQPDAFAALDLDRHRLSLDEEDHARFVAAQKAVTDGTTDPDFFRYRRARFNVDRALNAAGIETNAILGGSGQGTLDQGGIVPAAAGDLKCVGGDCASGGNRGATGMYSIEGRILCASCAIKRLGVGDLPAGEKVRNLEPFLLGK